MRKLLLTLMAVALLTAPVAFAADEVVTPGSKKMGLSTTGEEVGKKIEEFKGLAEDKKAEAKKQILERVKERAKFAVSNAVRKYERVKEKVQNLNVTEEQQGEIVDKLDAQITAMNSLKVQIEAAGSVDEVKSVMRKTQTQFKYSLGLVRQAIKGVYEDRLEKVLENSVVIYDKLTEKVASLDDGTTKTDLEALLAQSSTLLVSAESKLEAGDLDSAKLDLIRAKQTMSEVITSYNGLTE